MRTLEGQDNVPGQTYTVTKDKVECYNSKNPEKPEHPYRWVDANVTCRDWKIRYVDSDALSMLNMSVHSSPRLLKLVPAVDYHFCLAFQATFTQPGAHLFSEPVCQSMSPK